MSIVSVIVALFLVGLGLCIQKFKLYWLIAGYNTMSAEEKENVDIKGLAREMAICLYAMGGFFILVAIFGERFPQIEYLMPFVIIGGVLITIFRSGKYDKNKADKGELIGTIIIITIPIIISIFIFAITLTPVKLTFNANSINLDGNIIEIQNIESAKLLDEYPKMNKIIGSGLAGHKNGTFEVDGIGQCKVYTDTLKLPLLEIKANGMTYLVNSKNSNIINEVYEKIKK